MGTPAWEVTPPGVRRPEGVTSPGMWWYVPLLPLLWLEREGDSVRSAVAWTAVVKESKGLRSFSPAAEEALGVTCDVRLQVRCQLQLCDGLPSLRRVYLPPCYRRATIRSESHQRLLTWSVGPVGQKPLSMLAIYGVERSGGY